MPILSKSKSEKSALFTTATRFSSPNKNPGVGDYNVSNSSGFILNKCTIGDGLRDPITKPSIPARIYFVI